MTEAAEDQYLPQTGLAAKLNWLRAGVLGANDGIVSTAGLVVGGRGRVVEYRRDSHRGYRGYQRGCHFHGGR
jgi:hypothetical protein